MAAERNSAFYLCAGLFVISLAACTTHYYSIKTREPMVIAASPACIERAVSARYVLIDTRSDDTPDGKVRHLFFDRAKGEFFLDPEMRDYRLGWRRFDGSKLALTIGWDKRGSAITALERRHVNDALGQIYARLSNDCGFASTKLELVDG